jgi:phosphopantetheine--protein transferase-like protein
MLTDVAFRIDLPHGRCVGVRVPASVEQIHLLSLSCDLVQLADEERAFLESLSPARRPTWLAGRMALHAALRDLGLDGGPILVTKRGAPELPDGVTGSISHKQTLAVALVARKNGGLSLGVDIEPIPATPSSSTESGWDKRPDISSRVMTPEELSALASIPEPMRRREVVLHFSLKEALYKAINPLIGRYVSFQEATVLPRSDGGVTVTLVLSKQEGPFLAEARWLEINGHLLTTAAVRPSG